MKALILGASRGLGLGLTRQWLARGFDVVATRRGEAAGLEEVHRAYPQALRLEKVDIDRPAEVTALAERLAGEAFDLLLVNAGVSSPPEVPLAKVADAEITRVLFTNAISPIRAAEALSGLVTPTGTIAFMTSILGSIARCTGGYELYRVSKAALNMAAVCFATHDANKARTVLLLHPGWVRTDMGGPRAPLDVETATKGLAATINGHHGKGGVAYLDYQGETLPW
ncbi:MAG: SDR family oxidoreductase [Acidibrevibacterium sp.]|jgi:NAD(P)-dependent dehydrogenase (short-subunit alcohol dehydrogenase family)|uniref:SDR family oxidoreductase n=1 Tax=Acidibrevibacterium fodinaquatile TaxID=1969806 RepID=UPI0023A90C07|nr:SDR family oxidoreductase [Acidibrevibacterium fodinaquatile]MCA7118670.1 SDR family oxidoreductase [Acidibrevibacterium fodinaquatile]